MTKLPLVVDLDGTLLRTDLLFESIIDVLKKDVGLLLRLPLWLAKGRATIKREIATRCTSFPVATLPYNQSVLDYLISQKQAGRTLTLASASDILLVEKVAVFLNIFGKVIASDGQTNMKGAQKRKTLVDLYGERGFDYIGNDWVDLRVWKSCNEAMLVSPPRGLAAKAAKVAAIGRIFDDNKTTLKTYAKAIRLHQWVKNLLIFLPLLMAHQLFDQPLLEKTSLTFLTFGLCASGTYVINDLLDLEADRSNPKKKYRPFASGRLSISFGLMLIPLMAGLSLGLSLYLPRGITVILVGYSAITLFYSLRLKRVVILDVVCLAMLYGLRIYAGSVATGVPISKWLLTFALFFFSSLAFSKRFSELYQASKLDQSKIKGRSYINADLDCIATLGTASGMVAVLVFCLYVNSNEIIVLYKHPDILWIICPIMLAWISRLWLYTCRGILRDDPIIFAIKDKVSYLVGIVLATLFILAT